ncbi:MAG: aldose 1-epimerase family protein [Planctomycetaceae bacterium]|nr:aldose 1-epimerase family protein [Planctomycetaceae bacterium]
MFSKSLYNADEQLSARGTVLADHPTTGLLLAGSDQWSIASRTLQGGVSEGVEVIDLCNGPMTISVLPTRGMGVWRAQYRDLRLGWDSPVTRPVHPQHVNLAARNGLGWLDGFNELICRCGLAFNGPPGTDEGARNGVEAQLTLHGRVANIPAHAVTVNVDPDGPGTLAVTGHVEEATFFGPRLRMTSTISTRAGSNSFLLVDEITNLGGSHAELELLYHANFGPPFPEAGATVHCPARTIVPRNARAAEDIDNFHKYLGPTSGYEEQVYFFDLIPDAQNETLALLRTADGDKGVSLHFDRDQLPCFSVWKCTQSLADGYVTGLEPGTNYPNPRAYERQQGRVIRLAPGTSHTARLRVEAHDSMRNVAALQERIAALQIRSGPVIHRRPTPPFCAES